MRCIQIHAFGLAGLSFGERADPTPGPGEIGVRLYAASLNYRDLLMVDGEYNPRQALPLIPGSDGAGIVESVGPGVSMQVGTRVAGCFAPTWIDGPPSHERIRNTLGGPIDGTLAERVVLPANGVVTVPAHLSDEEAATLPCAAVTAWNALQGTKAGDVVLVQGTGGVSIFALQFAKLHGARVIITSANDDKLARAKALGADHTINYTSDKDWGKTAKKLSGRGVDTVIEVGGADTLAHSLRAVRIGGSIKLIGVLSGVKSMIALTQITMQAIKVEGLVVGSRAHFEDMNRAIAAHALKPVIAARFSLQESKAALQAMKTGAHFGKIVITI